MVDVAVCSRSMSRDPFLRDALLQRTDSVRFNDAGISLKGTELIEFLSGASQAVIALELLSEEIIRCCPDLKLISKYGVGIDNIDVEYLRRADVSLKYTDGVNRRAVSELALALMLMAVRNIPLATETVRMSKWKQVVGLELSSQTVGIIGYGNVGSDLAGLLKPFGSRVVFHDILNFDSSNAEQLSLRDLLACSDIVSLHVPLTKDTDRMVNQQFLKLMKRGSILVNTARGNLIDIDALKEAIETEQLSCAALDVFPEEPLVDRWFLNNPRIITTPHIGGSSQEAIRAMGMAAIKNLDDQYFSNNKPVY